MKHVVILLLLLLLLPLHGLCQTGESFTTDFCIPINRIDFVVFECIDINIMTVVNILPCVFDNYYSDKTKRYTIQNKDTINTLTKCINDNIYGDISDGIDTRGKIIIHYSEFKPDTVYYGANDYFFRGKYFLITSCMRSLIDSINTSLFQNDGIDK